MNEVKNALRMVVAATVLLYVVVATIGILGYLDTRSRANEVSALEHRTRSSLCTFRGDLVRRVTDSKEFLKTHPQGFPGISAAVIQQGIHNQQSTINALSNLNCGAQG